MLLTDRVALITGGAGGIGRGIALKFAQEGCSIAIADINLKGSGDVIGEVAKIGPEGLALRCDVTDSKQVKWAVDQVITKFGKIDVLINNAGGMSSTPPIEELSEESWDQVMDLNLKSDFLFCKSVIPFMKKESYGKIINISSIGAIFPPKHAIHYNSAKAGVLGFTYDLAGALAPFKINVNAIIPGLIQTAFYDPLIGPISGEEKQAFFRSLGKIAPLGRIGTPSDIAGAALFLASELSSFVTGTSILVSGGMPFSPQGITESEGKRESS
jgi:NAD(P)-dependent dehydrogenase (short-subunit alcohol dehydrogenase family)